MEPKSSPETTPTAWETPVTIQTLHGIIAHVNTPNTRPAPATSESSQAIDLRVSLPLKNLSEAQAAALQVHNIFPDAEFLPHSVFVDQKFSYGLEILKTPRD